MLPFDRSRTAAAAQAVLEQGGWCVLEACVDVPGQRWEPRVLICERDPAAVADAVGEELEREPDLDVRLAGCDRQTLRPDPGMGAALCYVAVTPAPSDLAAPPRRARRPRRGRTAMLVRDRMNPIVVTVGPSTRCARPRAG